MRATEKAEMVKPFLLDYLSRLGMRKTATSMYTCPLCGSGTGRNHSGAFSVFKQGTRWHCHVCDKGGDLVDLITFLYGVPWGKALQMAAKIYVAGDDMPAFTPVVKETVRSCIASVDKRNAFYTHLLGRLELSEQHRNDLLCRGVFEADLWQYRSVPDRIYSNTTKQTLTQTVASIIGEIGELPDGVPGFYVDGNGEWTVAFPCQGFLIPVRDMTGRIQGLQCRADDTSKRKYRWVSSNPEVQSSRMTFTNGTCAETAVHCHLVEPSDTLYITEGPLKADIAASNLNRTFIAIPGISSLNSLVNVLAAFKKRGYIRVVCALDMDRQVNTNVEAAVERIKGIVESAGMEWHDFVWNPNFSQNGLFKGIDDWAVGRRKKRGIA